MATLLWRDVLLKDSFMMITRILSKVTQGCSSVIEHPASNWEVPDSKPASFCLPGWDVKSGALDYRLCLGKTIVVNKKGKKTHIHLHSLLKIFFLDFKSVNPIAFHSNDNLNKRWGCIFNCWRQHRVYKCWQYEALVTFKWGFIMAMWCFSFGWFSLEIFKKVIK